MILSHPIEVKRRIATGRIAHLSLARSLLIQGEDFSCDSKVNDLIRDPGNQCLILYPKGTSRSLSAMSSRERGELVSREKNLVLFVIDGTWNTARKTMFRSQNLRLLPRICFTPPGPSQFRIRVQPEDFCYSTLEAIHHTIELLGPHRGFDIGAGEHHRLLKIFNGMVEQQIELKHKAHQNPLIVTGRQKKSRLLKRKLLLEA